MSPSKIYDEGSGDLFLRISIYGSPLVQSEICEKVNFYQTVTSFSCSSVSYFNTIYTEKSKIKKLS